MFIKLFRYGYYLVIPFMAVYFYFVWEFEESFKTCWSSAVEEIEIKLEVCQDL